MELAGKGSDGSSVGIAYIVLWTSATLGNGFYTDNAIMVLSYYIGNYEVGYGK